MSSNSFIWVKEGGDLSTADWGCLAGRCVSLRLQAAHAWWPCSWQLGLVTKSTLEALYARCAIQIDTFTFTFTHGTGWPPVEPCPKFLVLSVVCCVTELK